MGSSSTLSSILNIVGQVAGTVAPAFGGPIAGLIFGGVKLAEDLFSGISKAGTNKKTFALNLVSDGVNIYNAARGKNISSSTVQAALNKVIDDTVELLTAIGELPPHT